MDETNPRTVHSVTRHTTETTTFDLLVLKRCRNETIRAYGNSATVTEGAEGGGWGVSRCCADCSCGSVYL